MEMPLLVGYWREGRRLRIEDQLAAIEAAALPHMSGEHYGERVMQLREMLRAPAEKEALEKAAAKDGWAAVRAKAGRRK